MQPFNWTTLQIICSDVMIRKALFSIHFLIVLNVKNFLLLLHTTHLPLHCSQLVSTELVLCVKLDVYCFTLDPFAVLLFHPVWRDSFETLASYFCFPPSRRPWCPLLTMPSLCSPIQHHLLIKKHQPNQDASGPCCLLSCIVNTVCLLLFSASCFLCY